MPMIITFITEVSNTKYKINTLTFLCSWKSQCQIYFTMCSQRKIAIVLVWGVIGTQHSAVFTAGRADLTVLVSRITFEAVLHHRSASPILSSVLFLQFQGSKHPELSQFSLELL